MKIIPFQMFLSLLVIIAIIRLIVQYYKKHINTFFFLFFLAVWCLVFFLNWNNAILNKFGHLLGIERGATILVYIGLLLLSYSVFVGIIKFYKVEQDIDKLVQKDAVNGFLKRYGTKRK